NRVVIAPIGNGRSRDSGPKHIGRVEQGVKGHVTAIAPAVDTDARWIHETLRQQVANTIQLIRKFGFAELAKERSLESVASSRRAAIVQLPDHKAALREHLIPGCSGPGVAHLLHAGTAI